ncbi:phage portal protein [Burkholderia multivorans]|uniref:phage portal protein n=1 Tax=Burkholderia multivorans TaxID=87883 RepID=UPI001C21151D|nr:phage portal protein [Burkholderia multivorans]MBU9501320.1 phage portal protein [Burkholderia multivorans]
MGLFNFIRRDKQPEAQARPHVEPSFQASVPASPVPGETFDGLDDPRLKEYIRRGELDGGSGREALALRNMAVLRCVTLISGTIGMLPMNLISSDDSKTVLADEPAHRLLKYKPNDWQTPMEFKSLMQLRTMLDGESMARIVWSGNRPIRLIPLDRGSAKARLTSTWQIVYDYTTPAGDRIELPAREVFHLRDLSLDGVSGVSRVKLSRNALELAEQAERAASRTFRTGVMAGGAIEVPKELSDNAYGRMKASVQENHTGSENAGSWMLLEEGATAKQFSNTAASAQQIENRNHQIEEVARMYGVPRPLLMMDDTSWGSGIEQLAIFFIQYGLSHWFVSWEQASARAFLPEKLLGQRQFKFNEGALLRGTLNDQAAFFAKALGAGGQSPWMKQNEVREMLDLPRVDDPVADQLRNPMTQKQKGSGDEPPATT